MTTALSTVFDGRSSQQADVVVIAREVPSAFGAGLNRRGIQARVSRRLGRWPGRHRALVAAYANASSRRDWACRSANHAS
jgi:hypothetical protein